MLGIMDIDYRLIGAAEEVRLRAGGGQGSTGAATTDPQSH